MLAVSRSVPAPVLLPRNECQRVRFITGPKEKATAFDAAVLRMLKNLQQTFCLWAQAKTGVSGGLLFWLGVGLLRRCFRIRFSVRCGLCLVVHQAWTGVRRSGRMAELSS